MVLPQAMAWVQYWFRVLSLKFCRKSKKICGDISQLSPAFCMYGYHRLFFGLFAATTSCGFNLAIVPPPKELIIILAPIWYSRCIQLLLTLKDVRWCVRATRDNWMQMEKPPWVICSQVEIINSTKKATSPYCFVQRMMFNCCLLGAICRESTPP